MSIKHKHEIITFKVDESLLEAMQGIENRSEFIRAAISVALDNVCPLCRGTGFLSGEQRSHWADFAEHHSVEECGECHAMHLVCRVEEDNLSG